MEIITNNDLQARLALESLKKIRDPEIGLNIVDLGLIYQLDFEDQLRIIYVCMTFTTRFCPLGANIKTSVLDLLATSFPGFEVKVDVVFHPAWNNSMITEEGKNFLNR